METVGFCSAAGIELSADLYVPSADPPRDGHPTVICCLGWGSVKELMAPWADALTEAGYAVLIPDYRGFGASGGERGRCFPHEHVDDVRAALTYAAEREELDSGLISLVGVSYGGSIAVVAGSLDQQAAAVVSVVAYGSGERHLRAVRSAGQWNEFRSRLDDDRRTRVRGGATQQVDPDEILLRDDEAREWRRHVEEQYPHMAFRTTLESAEKIVDFRPEIYLPYPAPKPILFIHAEQDTLVPVAESERMWRRAAEPKRLVVIPGIGHHEVHSGHAFRRVIEEMDAWLREHVVGGLERA